MILHLVRVLFLLVVLGITVSFVFQEAVLSKGGAYTTWCLLVPALCAFTLIMADMLWKRKRLQTLSGLFFGVLTGLVIAYALSLIVDMVVALFPSPGMVAYPGPEPRPPKALVAEATDAERQANAEASKRFLIVREDYDRQMEAYNAYMAHEQTIKLIKLVIGAAAIFLCTTFVLQTKDDFRFVVPYVEFAKQTKGAKSILLDTSAIIDGRIADVAETHVLEAEMVVPRFILEELQAIADSDDKLKRNRGRRGLDVLNRLRADKKLEIRILDVSVPTVDKADSVDAKLVALAQHLDARIVTCDYNLNRIAQLRGVAVINLNDLANALKPAVLPGETLQVNIIKPGEEPGQGVGYLEDGTMVVVDQARDHVGHEVTVSVTSALQTSAGRMVFGKIAATAAPRREIRT